MKCECEKKNMKTWRILLFLNVNSQTDKAHHEKMKKLASK